MERLKQIGTWLKVNGEAIYGCGATAFGDEAGTYDPEKKDAKGKPLFTPKWEWRCTTKPGKLYVHLLKWPEGKFELQGVKGTITSAYMLADAAHTPLVVSQAQDHVTITLPSAAPDPVASVLALELKQ